MTSPELSRLGQEIGFAYDGVWELPNGNWLTFTVRHLPESDPLAGATFYVLQGSTREQIISAANHKKEAFMKEAA